MLFAYNETHWHGAVKDRCQVSYLCIYDTSMYIILLWLEELCLFANRFGMRKVENNM